jgi:hypothetical protein
MAKKVPTVFAIVKKPIDIALSLGGNHLKIKADAGAYMQPAAKPLRNLYVMQSKNEREKPVIIQTMPVINNDIVNTFFVPILSEMIPIGSCIIK